MRLPDSLFSPPIAHRGLWRPEGPPENSLAAIQAAVAAGYGVEFDVRLTADGEVVVFHDETLERLCGRPERVDAMSLAALREAFLPGGHPIPTLSEVLAAVDGGALILIELKWSGACGVLEPKVAALLDAYLGEFAVISFQAETLAWFAEHRPDAPRGLDAVGASDAEIAASEFELEHLFNGQFDLADPDFLVLAKEMAGGKIARRYRSSGHPVIAWTIRTPAEIDRDHMDNVIFEGFNA